MPTGLSSQEFTVVEVTGNASLGDTLHLRALIEDLLCDGLVAHQLCRAFEVTLRERKICTRAL